MEYCGLPNDDQTISYSPHTSFPVKWVPGRLVVFNHIPRSEKNWITDGMTNQMTNEPTDGHSAPFIIIKSWLTNTKICSWMASASDFRRHVFFLIRRRMIDPSYLNISQWSTISLQYGSNWFLSSLTSVLPSCFGLDLPQLRFEEGRWHD